LEENDVNVRVWLERDAREGGKESCNRRGEQEGRR